MISTEDHAYKELKTLTHNKDVAILRGDKDLNIVIMNKSDYITKIETMIEEGIKNVIRRNRWHYNARSQTVLIFFTQKFLKI